MTSSATETVFVSPYYPPLNDEIPRGVRRSFCIENRTAYPPLYT